MQINERKSLHVFGIEVSPHKTEGKTKPKLLAVRAGRLAAQRAFLFTARQLLLATDIHLSQTIKEDGVPDLLRIRFTPSEYLISSAPQPPRLSAVVLVDIFFLPHTQEKN